MTDDNHQDPPITGWAYIGAAAVIAAVGLLTTNADADFPELVPPILFGIAGLLAAIGVTTVGVTAALLRADWLRGRR